MSDPLVSIVTPCLNPGERLQACLSSVAGQTYARVEHIVIDGASSDGTQAHLKDAGVRFISEPDGGQADALRKGFALAKGELLGWLNADDHLRPWAIEAAVDTLLSTGADWVYGTVEFIKQGKRSLWQPPRKVGFKVLSWSCPVPQQGSLFTRAIYERSGGIDPSYHLAMDYDLWLRFVARGARPARIDRVLATFDAHQASKTATHRYSDFMREAARALSAVGARGDACVMLGRAAAEEALLGCADPRAAFACVLRSDLCRQAEDRAAFLAGVRVGLYLGTRSARQLWSAGVWRRRAARAPVLEPALRSARVRLGRMRRAAMSRFAAQP